MRLVIVDDHDLVREAMGARLGLMPDIEVVGSAADGAQGLALVEKTQPDLVILDFHMPQMNGAECAQRIKQVCPDCRILFLTGFPEDEVLLDTLGLAVGYVTKSASWTLLEQALQSIAQGKQFVDPNLVPAIMSRAAAIDQDQHLLRRLDPEHRLTPMEGRVAVLAARGQANQDVAEHLQISANTVKAHLQRVFRKLGVSGRKELSTRLSRG